MGPQVAAAGAVQRASFAGVPLDLISADSALSRIEAAFSQRSPLQVATVNIDFVVRAQRDLWLKAILNRSGLNLVDGMALVWALRALGHTAPGRVAGADLVPSLLQRMAESAHSVYLLGGAPAVAAEAVRRLKSRLPGLRVVGVESPPVRPVETLDPGISARIRKAAPSLLLVAFGNPKQEFWIDLHQRELEVPVAIGIGGTIDFLAGKRRRAPCWMQRSGLEWAMRLLQEPVRLGPRYAQDSLALARLLPKEIRARGGVSG